MEIKVYRFQQGNASNWKGFGGRQRSKDTSQEVAGGRLFSYHSGQGLIEYLILVCLISAASVAVVSVVGANLREKYEKVSAALRGDKSSLAQKNFTRPSASSTRIRGMDDFVEAAQEQEKGGW